MSVQGDRVVKEATSSDYGDTAAKTPLAGPVEKTKKKAKKMAASSAVQGGEAPKLSLSEQVRRLEDKEKAQRGKKLAYAKEIRLLRDKLDKLDKGVKKQRTEIKRLESQNSSLRTQRDDIFRQKSETEQKLQQAHAEAEKLVRDLDKKTQEGRDVDERLKQASFESRKHRTALASAFKLLPSLADQVTMRSLLRRTDEYRHDKIKNEEIWGIGPGAADEDEKRQVVHGLWRPH